MVWWEFICTTKRSTKQYKEKDDYYKVDSSLTLQTHHCTISLQELVFRIKSAAEIFHESIAETLNGTKGVRNMLNDFIIFSNTEEEHHEIF